MNNQSYADDVRTRPRPMQHDAAGSNLYRYGQSRENYLLECNSITN